MLQSLLMRWQNNELTAREVHEAAEDMWESYGSGPPSYPREDPRSIVVEVLSQLEALNVQLITAADIPEMIRFLETPVGAEARAWRDWSGYWDNVNFEARLEELADNPYYSKKRPAARE